MLQPHRVGEDAVHQSALGVIVEVQRLHLERQRLALLLAEVEDDDLCKTRLRSACQGQALIRQGCRAATPNPR